MTGRLNKNSILLALDPCPVNLVGTYISTVDPGSVCEDLMQLLLFAVDASGDYCFVDEKGRPVDEETSQTLLNFEIRVLPFGTSTPYTYSAGLYKYQSFDLLKNIGQAQFVSNTEYLTKKRLNSLFADKASNSERVQFCRILKDQFRGNSTMPVFIPKLVTEETPVTSKGLDVVGPHGKSLRQEFQEEEQDVVRFLRDEYGVDIRPQVVPPKEEAPPRPQNPQGHERNSRPKFNPNDSIELHGNQSATSNQWKRDENNQWVRGTNERNQQQQQQQKKWQQNQNTQNGRQHQNQNQQNWQNKKNQRKEWKQNLQYNNGRTGSSHGNQYPAQQSLNKSFSQSYDNRSGSGPNRWQQQKQRDFANKSMSYSSARDNAQSGGQPASYGLNLNRSFGDMPLGMQLGSSSASEASNTNNAKDPMIANALRYVQTRMNEIGNNNANLLEFYFFWLMSVEKDSNENAVKAALKMVLLRSYFPPSAFLGVEAELVNKVIGADYKFAVADEVFAKYC